MKTTLIRKSPEVDPVVLIGMDTVEYASQKLGYNHPKKQHLSKEGKLAHALRVAGITPFDLKSVKRYKLVKSQTFSKLASHESLLAAIFVCSIVAMVILGIVVSNVDPGSAKQVLRWSIYLLGLVAITFLVLFILGSSSKIRGRWMIQTLKDYIDPVPQFALATAREIHLRVPEAEFFIHEFVVKEKQQDPFLVVRLGEFEEYYVEVWDEPEYDQKKKI